MVLAPMGSMFIRSFMVDGAPSLGNYSDVLSDRRQLGLLANSVIIALGTAGFSILIGSLFGFLVDRTDIPFRKHFAYLFLTPLVIPPYLSAIAWIHLIGSRGALNSLLMRVFNLDSPPLAIYGVAGSIFVLTLAYFPFATLLTIAGLRSVDKKLEEAAELSRGWRHVLRKVTLPLISPHLWSAAVFVFIFSISNYSVPDLLRVKTFPIEIFIQFSAYYNEARATALSVPLALMLIALIALQTHHMKDRSYVTVGSGFRPGRILNLRIWKTPALILITMVLLLAVAVPLADLGATSGSILTYVTALRTAHSQILNSVLLAAVAATLMTILAFVIAYWIERSSGVTRHVLDYASLIPFAVPAVVLGIGLTTIWNRPALSIVYGTPVIVVIGYTARFIPFVVRATGSNLKQTRRAFEEAALLTEPRWTRRAVKVVIPLCKPGLLAGWSLAFVLAMGELATTLLVTPPGEATVPIRIYSLLHYGAHQLVAALCVILVIVTLIPVLLVLSIGGFRGFRLSAQ